MVQTIVPSKATMMATTGSNTLVLNLIPNLPFFSMLQGCGRFMIPNAKSALTSPSEVTVTS